MNGPLEKQLQRYFGYTKFRPGQKEIIEQVLQGNDVLGILPTGSGKSMCYQLPSVMLPHITVVISPLISLMIDQVRETKAFHIKEVVALHSMQSFEERKMILQQLHQYKIVYISPELIQSEFVIRALQRRKISLFVIDEAHCISQWGYDFRPDYLRLKNVLTTLGNPPLLALSGTITEEIQQDIVQELQRPEIKVFKHRTDRENITLIVEHIDSTQTKNARLIELLQPHRVPVIIYFSSRKQAEDIAQLLTKKLSDRNVAYYHGGLDQQARLKIQQQYLYDQLQIICATSAFGMGINKSNVRLIIHYHVPSQKESFIQEIGRAGRDGKASVSILLYERGDELIPQHLIENELPTEGEIRRFFNYLYVLYSKDKLIPKAEESIINKLDLNEIKLKFLLYQLEKRSMIVKKGIRYNYQVWQDALHEIVRYCEMRKQTKLANFDCMYEYVYTTSCLREELYKDFQESVKRQANNCCSSCGYDGNIIEDEFIETPQIKTDDWQHELAYLLGIGENNETR